VIVIALVVVIIVVIFVNLGRTGGRTKLTRKQRASIQEMINRGQTLPGLNRERLEKMGFKVPPNFDEIAAQATQRLPNMRGRPGGRSARGAAGSVK